MKLKLTLDARLVNSSGIGVYLQNIIGAELNNSFDLELLCHIRDDAFFNTDIVKKHYDAGLYSLKELFQTSSYTKNTDIFWSPHYNVPLLNYAKKIKIVTIHDVYHLAYFNTLSIKQKLYVKLVMNRAVNNADIIFTVSNFSKNQILKYFNCDPKKIKVVYNGIDFELFNNVNKNVIVNDVLNKYNIQPNYILFVGNVKPHKNLKTALLGFKRYLTEFTEDTNLKFIIIGKKEGFITGDATIFELLKDPILSKSVIFTGWVDNKDLPVIYQNASCFLFPSYYEGFGFPPLESMAAGVPVLSSNASCLTEIYGNAAYYFNPFDEKAIAVGLNTVLTDEKIKNELVEAGYVQAQKYTWNTCVNEIIKYINEGT
ncbi:glycosyltransferase family 4 protein [Mucilaginibacter sp.]